MGLRNVTAFVVVIAVAAPPAFGNPEAPTGSGVPIYVPIVAVAVVAAGLGAYLFFRPARRPDLRFDAEEVTITLAPGRAAVVGHYTFVNSGADDGDFTLAYPFPGPKFGGKPENVSFSTDWEEPLTYEWKGARAYFIVSVPAGAAVTVNVSFEQPLRGQSYVYILKSSRTWKRPIKDATFVVDAPAAMGEIASHYPLVETAAPEGRRRYELHRTNFYPSADLELKWKPAAAEPVIDGGDTAQ